MKGLGSPYLEIGLRAKWDEGLRRKSYIGRWGWTMKNTSAKMMDPNVHGKSM